MLWILFIGPFLETSEGGDARGGLLQASVAQVPVVAAGHFGGGAVVAAVWKLTVVVERVIDVYGATCIGESVDELGGVPGSVVLVGLGVGEVAPLPVSNASARDHPGINANPPSSTTQAP